MYLAVLAMLALHSIPSEILAAAANLKPGMTVAEVELVLSPLVNAQGYYNTGGTGSQVRRYRLRGGYEVGLYRAGLLPNHANELWLEKSTTWRYLTWEPTQAEANEAFKLARPELEWQLLAGVQGDCPPGGSHLALSPPTLEIEALDPKGVNRRFRIDVGGFYRTHRLVLMNVVSPDGKWYVTHVAIDMDEKKVVPLDP